MAALTTAGPDHNQLTACEIPGAAGAMVRELGPRATVHGFDDEAGARIHGDLLDGDLAEVREVLRAVLDVPGCVLDLAAGSGHLTMPLLALRREVTAADSSPHRLAGLRRRLRDAPAAMRARCATAYVDLDGFALGTRFAVIVLGASMVAGLDVEGRARLFGCVREHLAPGGRFLLSTVDHGELALPTETESAVRTPGGKVYRVHEYWEPGASSWFLTAYPARLSTGIMPVCAVRRHVVDVTQLQAELGQAGLTVVSTTALPVAGARHRPVLVEAVRSEDRGPAYPFLA
ncbi:daptide-type RiPP biosynthesis methyltransferase [Georgenia subflava]|uniref:Methyltransferase domain-containing protein n=1 Tax=Georgenia subflava TaxID=1622177 RepID=A0A6N7EQ80_9MICO|nr:daptide-type RiPP biosynthesis methyltransferase [Georgenia subflava]MPV38665.1 methyltransferase domain-containing protein [Georgenia subflava]